MSDNVPSRLYILAYWLMAIGSLIGRFIQASEDGRPLDYAIGMVIGNLLLYVVAYGILWLLCNVRLIRR